MRLHRIVAEGNEFALWRASLAADAAHDEIDSTKAEQYRQRYAAYCGAVQAGGTKEAMWRRYQRALEHCL